MKIQVISNNKISFGRDESIYEVSTLAEPSALDDFDINIIDLNSKTLWRYDGRAANQMEAPKVINDIDDFKNLGFMISRSTNAAIIVVFPCNTTFYYNYLIDKYHGNTELKNCLPNVNAIISTLAEEAKHHTLYYENTVTEIGGMEYTASFNFDRANEPLTVSRSSEKITSYKASDRVIFTTLKIIESAEHVLGFLRKCNLISDKEEYPQWLYEYCILDDKEQQDKIAASKAEIEMAENIINIAEEKLKENLEYKSILYANEKPLCESIFKILEQILTIDLSNFKDINKEDFLIQFDDDLEFIGEIKGVTSNINSTHVSQLELHYQSRLDVLRKEKINKTLKALLIMNPSRTKPINEREPVHKDQIELALRNKSLIIETKVLLHIYEKFISGELSPDKCKEMFRDEEGLLKPEIVSRYLETV